MPLSEDDAAVLRLVDLLARAEVDDADDAIANFGQIQQLKAHVADLLPYKVKYEKIQATVQLDRQRQLQKQQQQKPGGGGDAT